MSRPRGAVLALGTFDGVHRGHQAILKKAVSRARALGVPAVAVTFRRPPRLFFSPSKAPCLLTLPGEKAALMGSLGVGRVAALTFGAALAKLSAEDFFSRRLRRRWKAREIVVGYNFGFGRGREGTPGFLSRRGADCGIPVHVVPAVRYGKDPVSSGRIREFLCRGELASANVRLGRAYFATGRVARGAGRGRTLGWPTANVKVAADKILPPGVFAVRVSLPGGRERDGMANVGVRPTLKRPDARPTLEVHLFGFRGNIVGKTLRVSFVKKLREERRFPSLDHLRRQLSRDARAARRAL